MSGIPRSRLLATGSWCSRRQAHLYLGPILIENNTIIGGSIQGPITNVLSNGIYVFGSTMRNVMIRNNVIKRTGQSGIRIEGTRINVVDNRLTDASGAVYQVLLFTPATVKLSTTRLPTLALDQWME